MTATGVGVTGYEAAMAFKAMGSNGVTYLVQLALQEEKPDWRDNLSDFVNQQGYRPWSQYVPFYRNRWDRKTPASDMLHYELNPSAELLIPLLTKASRSTNDWELEKAAELFNAANKETKKLILPQILEFASHTNESVRYWGVAAMESYAKGYPSEIFPALTNALKDSGGKQYMAFDALMQIGETARPATPLLESIRQSGGPLARSRAIGALLKLNPERVDLLTVLTNSVAGTNRYEPTASLCALQTLGTNVSSVAPLLKELALGTLRTNDTRMLVIWALTAVSKPDAIEALEDRVHRTIAEAEFDGWLWDAGELIHIAPTESRLRALEALELRYDAMVEHDGWEEWRLQLIKMLKPDEFEESPPSEVVQFLERIAKDDPDAKVRRMASQALKYFKLRWPVEGKKQP